ncbi:MAG: hypothetical protein WCL21_12320 [Mariniphaga sp.]
MKRILLLSLLITCFPWFNSNAQLILEDQKKSEKSIVEVGLDYSSNSGDYGIFNSFSAQSNTIPSISYYGEKGMKLSLSGLFIGNSNASSLSKGSSEVDITGGWDFNLWNSGITVSPSYSHFIYSTGAATSKSIYSDQTELALSGSFNWFRPSLTSDYLLGAKKAFNFNASSGFNFKWENIFKKGNILEFEPAVSANYGDLSYSTVIAKRLFQFLSPLRAIYGDAFTIQQLEANGAIRGNKPIQKQLSNFNPATTLGQIFTSANKPQINSIDLSFPITYLVKNIAINSGLNVSKPMNVPSFIKSQTIIFVSAGFSYAFGL